MHTKSTPIQIDEYELPGGESVTLTKHGDRSFDVDMWRADGDNHWNIWFSTEANARIEFERWRTR